MIDEEVDAAFIKALETQDERYFAAMPAEVLVEGTSEIRNWIILAGAKGRGGKMVDYVPCYRQPSGVGCAMGVLAVGARRTLLIPLRLECGEGRVRWVFVRTDEITPAKAHYPPSLKRRVPPSPHFVRREKILHSG